MRKVAESRARRLFFLEMQRAGAAGEPVRGVYERHVRESLRKIAELSFRDGIVLLGEKAEVVS
jgi:hypothetical protein